VVRRTTPTTAPGSVAGASWIDATGNLAGLPSECGNLSHVSARPGGGLIAGVALQGLWSSTDGGEKWDPLGDAEGTALKFRMTTIVYDPEQPARFWVDGIYDTGGAYETGDDGATFRQLFSDWNSVTFAVDLSDPDRRTMIVAVDPIDVRKSVDGGESWEPVAGALPDEVGRAAGSLAVDSQTYLIGTREGEVPGIFRTTDGGGSWSRVHPTGVAGSPLRARDGGIYWLIERGGGVVHSADEGATWTVHDGEGISPFAENIVELPDGRLATISNGTLIVSSDEGDSWTSIGPAMPYEPSGVAYSEADQAFYIWRSDCEWNEANPVRPGSILRLDFESQPAA
jgi:photosystem II stability/assembly factor-like uncharacterized protein